MFNSDADLFFSSPEVTFGPPLWFSVLYLLRRDINSCMGIDSDSKKCRMDRALWPGAMAIMAGIDLLAKFYAGSDDGKVGARFSKFLLGFFDLGSKDDADYIWKLRNALMHSFGLFSRDPEWEKKCAKGKKVVEYRFALTYSQTFKLIESSTVENQNIEKSICVDVKIFHDEFERAVERYRQALEQNKTLKENFQKIFKHYGQIYIG
jgi:hypothetical protein